MTLPSVMRPRVSVCHVAYSRYPGDPRVRKEVRALHAAGFVVEVLCLRAAGESPPEIPSDVLVRRLPLEARRGGRFRYAYQYMVFLLLVAANLLFAQLRRRYRVVHVHSLPDFLILAALPCRLLGARLVLDLHESMPEIFLARFPGGAGFLVHRLALAAQRLSCAVATRIITVNSTIAGILESRGVPSKRIAIVENSPDWLHRPSEMRQGPMSDGSYEITILGGLNPERDIPIVLEAASGLRDTFRIRWRIIGPGEPAYVGTLRNEVRARGLEDVVTIEGEVPSASVPSLIAASTIGVVSYQRNPLTEIATPNKAYEYAVAEKAMVVANLGGLRSLLGDTVLYYQPGEGIDLARKIAILLGNPSERERLGQAARRRIEDHRWEIMAGRLVETYRECLSSDNRILAKGTRRGSTGHASGRFSGGR